MLSLTLTQRRTLLVQPYVVLALMVAFATLIFMPRAHAQANGRVPVIRPPMPRYMAPLVMVRSSSDVGSLIVSDPNGMHPTTLPIGAWMPKVSPRGDIVAFWMQKPAPSGGSMQAMGGGPTGDLSGIWLMKLSDGTLQNGETPIFDDSPGSGHVGAYDFCWGPDGRHLYVAAEGGPTGTQQFIWEKDTWLPKQDPVAIGDGNAPFVFDDQLFSVSHTKSGYDVTGSTVHIKNLDGSGETIKDFPGMNVIMVQTEGRDLYYTVSDQDDVSGFGYWLYRWRFGEPGNGTRVTSQMLYHFTLAKDGFIYASSAFYVSFDPGVFGCYKISPRTGATTFLGYGLYPDVGPLLPTFPRLWPGFTDAPW